MGEIYYIDRLIIEHRADLRKFIIRSQQERFSPAIEVRIKTLITALKCYRQSLMDELGIVCDGKKYKPKE